MLQHLRTVLLATATLVALGALHRPSTATAQPAAVPSAPHNEAEQLESARVSSLVGASVRSIGVGF